MRRHGRHRGTMIVLGPILRGRHGDRGRLNGMVYGARRERLAFEAAAAGGRVEQLMGNHEVRG